jgi:hypothetical protein
MSRTALQCAVFIIVGFVVGRWLNSALHSANRISPRTAQVVSAKHVSELPPASLPRSPARILDLSLDGGGLRRDAELYDALQAMRAEDFRDALPQWTEEIRQNVFRDAVRCGAILDRWFELDPTSAKAFVEKTCAPVPGERLSYLVRLRGTIAASAARFDPQWALEHLLREIPFPAWDNPNQAVMYEAVRQNPSLAKEWIARTENSKLHGLLMPGYVRGIAERDPLAAVDVAIAEKGFERLNLIPMAVNAAASQGKGLLLEVLEKIDDADLRRRAALGAMEVLAQETNSDPLRFFEDTIGLNHLNEINRIQFPLEALVQWNPSAAANWAAGLPLEHRSDVTGQLLERWRELDPQAARNWIENQTAASSAKTPAPALADLARVWTASELLNAGKTQEAISALADVRTGGPMIGIVTQKLIGEDPVATAQLALTLPECQARADVAGTVAAYWTTQNPAAAAQWVQQLPAGPSRNAALSPMISAFVDQDPESAAPWVGLYTDPQTQVLNIRLVYGHWTARDPEAARKWFNSLTCVDEHWKTKFLRQNP